MSNLIIEFEFAGMAATNPHEESITMTAECNTETLRSLKVPELKERLKEAGLSLAGKKAGCHSITLSSFYPPVQCSHSFDF